MDDNDFSAAMLALKAKLYSTTDDPTLRKVALRVAPLSDPASLNRRELTGVIGDFLEDVWTSDERDSRLDQVDRWLTPLGSTTGYTSGGSVGPVVPPVWRRDLKIIGQIGDLKSGLSFVSYLRQIDSAVNKGHTDAEIIEAVLRAINPGNKLKSYLEGREDLDLATLNAIVKSYYKEKSATELYQELCSLSQSTKETAQEFIFRSLDLRQQVLFASMQKEADMRYDPDLVQNMTMRSLSTGLRDDNIHLEFQATLTKKGVTDEELVQSINALTALDTECKSKIPTEQPRKSANARAIHVAPDDSSNSEQKSNKVNKEIEELRAEIASLRQHVDKNNGKVVKSPTERKTLPRRRNGCPNCKQAGKEEKCDHCFKCGSINHWQRGCRVKLADKLSGNATGSPHRGQE